MPFAGICAKREERLLESHSGRRYTAAESALLAVDRCHRVCARNIIAGYICRSRALVK